MVLRGQSERGSWEFVQRAAHPLLRPYVRGGYEGYDQAMRSPVRRLEVPHGGIVLIVGWGPEIDVDGVAHTSFVAGLHDCPVVVTDSGRQAGVQANLTPLGARMLVGIPMRELTGQTVALNDVLDDALSEQLHELGDWEARFAALDGVRAACARRAHRVLTLPMPGRGWMRRAAELRSLSCAASWAVAHAISRHASGRRSA